MSREECVCHRGPSWRCPVHPDRGFSPPPEEPSPPAGDVEAAKRLLTYIHEQMTGARPEEWEWRLMEKLGLPAYVTRLLAAQREQGFTEGWDLAHMPAVCGHARANYKDPKYGTIEYAGEEECEACAHLEPWVGLLREARAMISRALDWYMDDEPERDELTARIDAALAALDGEENTTMREET